MPTRAIEEFVAELGRCNTAEELFAVYRAEVEAAGFQNVVFSQLGTDEGFEIPFISAPDSASSVYFSENLAEDDPVLSIVQNTSAPFTWAGVMASKQLSRPARRVMHICRDLKMHSGLTIPLHGPGGRCDLFSLSLRDKRSIDPASIPIVTMKSYATWLRYYEIDEARTFAVLERISGKIRGIPDRSARREPHRDGSAKISQDKCQALVIADVAHRRYRAGLTELNDKLPSVLGDEKFERLKRRGLIYDEPDDFRWRYFARPSPIALSHLRTCSAVQDIRDRIWQLHVRMDERPSE